MSRAIMIIGMLCALMLVGMCAKSQFGHKLSYKHQLETHKGKAEKKNIEEEKIRRLMCW